MVASIPVDWLELCTFAFAHQLPHHQHDHHDDHGDGDHGDDDDDHHDPIKEGPYHQWNGSLKSKTDFTNSPGIVVCTSRVLVSG